MYFYFKLLNTGQRFQTRLHGTKLHARMRLLGGVQGHAQRRLLGSMPERNSWAMQTVTLQCTHTHEHSHTHMHTYHMHTYHMHTYYMRTYHMHTGLHKQSHLTQTFDTADPSQRDTRHHACDKVLNAYSFPHARPIEQRRAQDEANKRIEYGTQQPT